MKKKKPYRKTITRNGIESSFLLQTPCHENRLLKAGRGSLDVAAADSPKQGSEQDSDVLRFSPTTEQNRAEQKMGLHSVVHSQARFFPE